MYIHVWAMLLMVGFLGGLWLSDYVCLVCSSVPIASCTDLLYCVPVDFLIASCTDLLHC